MKPVFQTKFGGPDAPESEQGNCLAAALASVFEVGLDEVPDLTGHINDGSWYHIILDWLAKRNLTLTVVKLESGHPMGIHLMPCLSTTLNIPGDDHVVVIENGNTVHDPNPNAREHGRPIEYWVFAALDPARAKGG